MIKRIILTAFIAFLGSLGFVFLQNNQSVFKLVSPAVLNSKLPTSENIWLPKIVPTALADDGAPEVTAQAGLFIDTGTGEVLYQKNIHQKMAIASLTKIMTAIVADQKRQLTDVMSVSDSAANMEPDHMGLLPGEKLTLDELLDGLFLESANDAAEVLAQGITGNRDEFISLMNEKASLIGMNDSHFINPTGLDEDGKDQYSSAYDVILMSRYAITHYPHLVDITSQPYIDLPETSTHQEYGLTSGISLVTTYPGVLGFKIGYTPAAGLTIVTLARKNGHEILGVLLNSDDRREETRALLDYSFKKVSS
jgi:serine-type D-Ala-D-Ala carboxypeptidase (penicillin-binding protein 5/6)